MLNVILSTCKVLGEINSLQFSSLMLVNGLLPFFSLSYMCVGNTVFKCSISCKVWILSLTLIKCDCLAFCLTDFLDTDNHHCRQPLQKTTADNHCRQPTADNHCRQPRLQTTTAENHHCRQPLQTHSMNIL